MQTTNKKPLSITPALAVAGTLGVCFMLAGQAALAAESKPTGATPLEFQGLAIRLEFNQTDDDAEAVIFIDAGLGLKGLLVTSPSGRVVLGLTARDNKDLGLAKLTIETPEPTLEEVEAAYPEGRYRFRGITTEGKLVRGEAELSHDLPPAPVITHPQAGAGGVAIAGLKALWQPADDAERYEVTLEQEDLQIVLKADVLPPATQFDIPRAWLMPDTDYVLGVVVTAENGNKSGSEVRFHTAR